MPKLERRLKSVLLYIVLHWHFNVIFNVLPKPEACFGAIGAENYVKSSHSLLKPNMSRT